MEKVRTTHIGLDDEDDPLKGIKIEPGELERMSNPPPPQIEFKFEIKQKVYSQIHKRNGMVSWRQFVQTIRNSYIEYGVWLDTDSGDVALQEITEEWLEKERAAVCD